MNVGYRDAAPREAETGSGSSCYLCGTRGPAWLSCGGCGGDSMARVRCASCEAANNPDAIACRSCSAKLGGILSEAIPCPACRGEGRESNGALPFRPLRGTPNDEVVFHGCPTCQGVFIGPEAWVAITLAEAVELHLPPHRPSDRTVHPIGALLCPSCDVTLEDAVFGGYASGIAIDYCRSHGTWFDRGELAAALDWLRSKRKGERPAPMLTDTATIDTWQSQLRVAGNVSAQVRGTTRQGFVGHIALGLVLLTLGGISSVVRACGERGSASPPSSQPPSAPTTTSQHR